MGGARPVSYPGCRAMLEPQPDPPPGSGIFKATFIGGLLFLLPIVLIVFLLGEALGFAQRLSQPVVEAAGVDHFAGVAAGTIVAILALVLLSFTAGLVARTRFGQFALDRLEGSLLSLFPQWRMARGMIESLEGGSGQELEVVMVPADAGWCLAFVLEKPEGEWWTVFVPGAPHCTSGAVAFAHVDQVRPSGLTPGQAVLMMRRCGAGSARIRALLASLQERGEL